MLLIIIGIILLLQNTEASFSDRYSPSNTTCYTYTFEEGQYDPAINDSISGPVFQQMGNITLLDKYRVDWINNATISRQGIRSAQIDIDAYLSTDRNSAYRSSNTISQTTTMFSNFTSGPNNGTFTVEVWFKVSLLIPGGLQSTNIFYQHNNPKFILFGGTDTELATNSFWNLGYEGIDLMFMADSAGLGDTTGYLAQAVDAHAATTYQMIQRIRNDGLGIGNAYENLRFKSWPTGPTHSTNDAAAGYLFTDIGTYRMYGFPYRANSVVQETEVYLIAFYNEYLTDAQINQNFNAGLPPSIPYSRIYNYTGPAETLFLIPFSSVICQDVDGGSLTVELSTNVTAGTLFVAIGGQMVPVPSFPYIADIGDPRVGYVGPFLLIGTNVANFTYRCYDGSLYSVYNVFSLSLTFTNHRPTIGLQSSYIGNESSYIIQTFNVSDIDPLQNLTITISSLPVSPSVLYQYNNGCPGTIINTVPRNVTDYYMRVCLKPIPSGVYPTTQVLPADSGSGEFYVGNVTYGFFVEDSLGGRSVSYGNISTVAINHLQPQYSVYSGLENVIIDVNFEGFNLLAGSSQHFDVILEQLPAVGTLYINGTVIAELDTVYDNLGFSYQLVDIHPGTVSITYRLLEQNIRAWTSFQGQTTIINENTAHQPNMTLPVIPDTGYLAYKCNPVLFPAMINLVDKDNWPANRVLHLSILGNGISIVFCLPTNLTELVGRHLATNGEFNPLIQFDQGAGCGDATLEITAPYDILNEMVQHITIYGNTFLDTTFRIAACLYDPELILITCDDANPQINFYSVFVRVLTKECPQAYTYASVWHWFSFWQYFLVGFALFICATCLIFVPFMILWQGTVFCCNSMCCCTRGYICNECVGTQTEQDLPALKLGAKKDRKTIAKLESDNNRLRQENIRLNQNITTMTHSRM